MRVLKNGYPRSSYGRECCQHSSAFIFDRILFILAGIYDNHKRGTGEFEIRTNPPRTAELAVLECLKKSIYNVVNTLAPSFFIGSSLICR